MRPVSFLPGAFGVLMLFSLPASGQDPTCTAPLAPKVQKLVDKGMDKRKYDADKRKGFLLGALEEDENAWSAAFALGALTFRDAQMGSRSSGRMEDAPTDPWAMPRRLMLSVHEACPAYAAEVPYTLGAIAYATGNHTDALDWFDRFLRWPHFTGKPHTPRDLGRVAQVEEVLPELRFLSQFNAHASAPDPVVLDELSTQDAEYLPALSADGTLLFFTRAGERKAKGDLVSRPFETFSWARRPGPSSAFDGGTALGAPFDKSSGYGGASISIDNRSLFLAIKTPTPGAPENIDLYSARYELLEGKGPGAQYLWSEPTALSTLNTPDGWESQPAISPDGKWLYFAAVRPGTTEDSQGNPSIDILVSERQQDGSWAPAGALPPPINGPFSDKAPYLHPDGRTLYFASNRQPGGGGYDIWMTQLDSTAAPDEAGAWSDPINLGMPVNSAGDEHGLVISADGRTAYFSSRRPGTQGLDILTWPLPESLRPKASVVVKGHLDVGESLRDTPISLELRYAQSRQAEAIELGDDGAYAAVVDLSKGEDVLLVAKADGAAFSAGIVIDSQEEEPALVTADLTVRSVEEKGAAFEIQDIYYATGSADISRTSLLLLDLFAEYLTETGWTVEIGGHTDDVGSEADNLQLSDKRAQAVREHLLSAGVPQSHVTAKGYGETVPRASNETAEGRRQNRRTEFRLTER